MHTEIVDAPLVPEYLPVPHAVHVLMLVAMSVSLQWPAPHLMHCVCAVFPQVPATQSEHDSTPAVDTLPFAQLTHAAFTSFLPATQSSQLEKSLVDTLPPLHPSHVDAPLEAYSPATHAPHALSDTCPSSLEAVPTPHRIQTVSSGAPFVPL